MTRDQRDLSGLIVAGSDHLTAYNVYAEALAKAGYVGEVYGLPRHLFDETIIERWADRRGVLVKAIEDTALAMASVCRTVGVALPPKLPMVDDTLQKRFCDLVARIMPFALVIDEETSDGQEARVSRSSVAGSWGAVAGTLRYFADRFGTPRASIEGTQLPNDLVRKYAVRSEPEIEYVGTERRDGLVRRTRVTYFGFELDRDEEFLDEFPPEDADAARAALANALASEEARHQSVRRNREGVRDVRELYRRSGGRTPRLSQADLAAKYKELLESVHSIREYRAASLRLDLLGLVETEDRVRLFALPDMLEIRGVPVGIDYDVEEVDARVIGVARLMLPEKLARTLVVEELPAFDRPLRFAVHRGQRGGVRAATLGELQELLDRPWMPDERPSRREERQEEFHRRRRQGGGDARSPGEKKRFEKARDGRNVNPRRRRGR